MDPHLHPRQPYASNPSQQAHIPLSDIGKAIKSACQEQGLSEKTAYLFVCWARRFIMFHHCAHPNTMGVKEVETFIHYVALDLKVAVSTQNQALQAICFLFKNVLHQPLPASSINNLRAKAPKRLPRVMPSKKVFTFLDNLIGTSRLVAILQFGCGLRLSEIAKLKVKDADFRKKVVRVDGGQERLVTMPISAMDLLHEQVRVRCIQCAGGLKSGRFADELLFVSDRMKVVKGVPVWPPLHPRSIQRAYRLADPDISPKTLRQAFAIALLDYGANIREVQELMGQKDIRSTFKYYLVSTRGPAGTTSPIDFLNQV